MFCAAIFLFSGSKVYNNYSEARRSREATAEMSAVVTLAPARPAVKPEQQKEDEPAEELRVFTEFSPISVDFEALLEKNSDTAAWVYCPDTVINYPIMHTEDNKKYLEHLTDGSFSYWGTLFADYRNSGDFFDPLTVVYGHNMRDKTMFGSLSNYSRQKYYESHPIWYLETPEHSYKIVLFSGYTTPSNGLIYNTLSGHGTLADVLEEASRETRFDSGLTVPEGAQVIVFSTCSAEFSEARFVLLGYLEEIGKYIPE